MTALNINRNRLTQALLVILAVPALALPAACLIYIIVQGISAMITPAPLTSDMAFGTDSHLLPQLTGSLLLALGACLLATPLAIGTALYHQLLASTQARRSLDAVMVLLQGTPPIVFGLCGLLVFVHSLQWGVSLLSGAIILAMVVLPLITLQTISALNNVEDNQVDAARALGLRPAQIIWRIWLPQTWPNILTGVFLGIARALSETAPILFTATVFSGVVWPTSLLSPVTTLQTHIFYLAQEGNNPQAIGMAWQSALLLISMVALFSLLARRLRRLELNT